jgi:hypothetical protein
VLIFGNLRLDTRGQQRFSSCFVVFGTAALDEDAAKPASEHLPGAPISGIKRPTN